MSPSVEAILGIHGPQPFFWMLLGTWRLAIGISGLLDSLAAQVFPPTFESVSLHRISILESLQVSTKLEAANLLQRPPYLDNIW